MFHGGAPPTRLTLVYDEHPLYLYLFLELCWPNNQIHLLVILCPTSIGYFNTSSTKPRIIGVVLANLAIDHRMQCWKTSMESQLAISSLSPHFRSWMQSTQKNKTLFRQSLAATCYVNFQNQTTNTHGIHF